ncbi:MAG: alpha/beta fold hydrolase [Planktomarina sp.]
MPIDNRAGIAINWMQRGQGEPALMVHCTLAHHKAWTGVMQGLVNQLDMIAFDMPDHGRSGQTPTGTDMQRAAADVILNFLDLPRHVIAHSFGATAAMLAAMDAPDRVLSLTLIEPVLFPIAKGTDAYQQNDAALQPFSAAWDRQDREGAAQAFVHQWGDGRPWGDLPTDQRAYITDRIHVVHLQSPSVYADINNVAGPGRIEGLTMPVSLISGTQSPAVAHTICDAIHRRLPNGQAFEIAGAGHMLPMTHPQAVVDIIAAGLSAQNL